MSEKSSEYSSVEVGEAIEVEQDEWRVAEPPDSIETTGMGPCVGVIVYDPVTKRAVCGHFLGPETGLDEMLQAALEAFSNESQLKIYVGGIQPEREEANHKARRKETIEVIKSHKFEDSQMTVKWTQSPNGSSILRIDTQTGQVDYDIIDILPDEHGRY